MEFYRPARQIALPWLAQVRQFRESRQRWLQALLFAALCAVIVGCILAIDRLNLAWSDVRLAPLIVIAAIVAPLSITYSALNMMLMGHAAKVPMSFWLGVKVSVFAQIAEILPIPGGAIVRGGALIRAGSPVARSAELVIAFSLLWIACGGVGAGFALGGLGWPAHVLAAGCAVGVFVIFGWLTARFGAYTAATATALRVLGVALVAWRFMLAFAVIGVAVPWLNAMAFAFATILGTASSLVPAGLGVSEGLSALIAEPAGVTAAAAFLAAALSRLVGMGVNLIFALGYLLAGKRHRADQFHG